MAFAQGRGTACPATFVFALVAALCCCTASATVWTVGNSSGWDIEVNYTTWASGKTFKKGDVLFFPYAQSAHDVAVVNKTGYDTCTWSTSNKVYTTGNTNITLNATSYYLCTFPSHCTAGMRLAVNVVAGTSPTHAPAPAPSSRSPSPAPGSAPAKAPASSPTNEPTPTPSPASTATPPTPASAATPTTPASATPPGSGSSAPPGSSSSPSPPSSSSPSTPAPSPSSAPYLHAAADGVAAVLSILLGSTLLL